MAQDSPENPADPMTNWQAELAQAVEEIGKMHMPFGKFGPQQHPPKGVPLYDLPVDYLMWFRQKGFPTGRLGKLLELTCQIKMDGAEAVFEPFRKKAGGRHPLKPARRKEWDFGN